MADLSLAQRLGRALARLSPARRRYYLDQLTVEDALDLEHAWEVWGRGKQQRPELGERSIALWLAGRGFGKTRTLCEIMTAEVMRGEVRLAALVGREQTEVEQYMVGLNNTDGKGFLNVAPPWFKPEWRAKDEVLVWPNGAVFHTSSGEVKEFRGGSYERIWGDEFAFWKYRDHLLRMILYTLREIPPGGEPPRLYLTTTPTKCKLLRELVADPDVLVIRGASFDNEANLAPAYSARLRKLVQTRQGREEVLAELLDDNDRALFRTAWIEAHRVDAAPPMRRVAIGVDPAVTAHQGSDLTGIVVAGETSDGRFCVLEDLSGRYTPEEWATVIAKAFDRWRADVVVAEVNRGGDLVLANLRNVKGSDGRRRALPARAVRATKGKALRAEPVATLYEQGQVRHVGTLAELETELTEWDPSQTESASPNRLDAAVYALWELAVLDADHTPKAQVEEADMRAIADANDHLEREAVGRWERRSI